MPLAMEPNVRMYVSMGPNISMYVCYYLCLLIGMVIVQGGLMMIRFSLGRLH
jgi:hypothetical protein